jgi:hypothetical protein
MNRRNQFTKETWTEKDRDRGTGTQRKRQRERERERNKGKNLLLPATKQANHTLEHTRELIKSPLVQIISESGVKDCAYA